MANLFDGLQDGLFDLTKKVFGYDASWTPSVGGAALETKVLFREPTQQERMEGGYEYNPQFFYMEFRTGDEFSEYLYDSVRQGLEETVIITIRDTARTFLIRDVQRRWDGDTFQASIEEVTP